MVVMKGLNENQSKAVNWGEGPLLVLAGPGSGKTLVLTMRVARLIQQTPDARFRVLGLTFTTKAADEMRQRVAQLLGPDVRRARLTTFHSFCAEVLRQHGSHVGLRPDYEILTQEKDRLSVLDEAIQTVSRPETSPVDSKSVLKILDHLLRDGFDGHEDTPLPFARGDKEWIRPIFNAYARTLVRNNHLDFGTLLVCCLRLFRERLTVAKHYGIVFPYICVDEYQDTNKAQDLLLRALCPQIDDNLFVVADDDQIIYQWNGASPARLSKLRLDYRMPVIQLPESYRCPPAVIDMANNLIRHNTERSPDKSDLVAASAADGGNTVRVHYFEDHDQEMAWVARDIGGQSVPLRECAVLARSTKLLRVAADALRGAGLSPYVTKRKGEFESAALRFVHAAMRLANAPQDDEQLQRLCRAFFDLTGEDVRADDAEAEGAVHNGSLLRGFLGAVDDVSEGEPWAPLLQTLGDQLIERLHYREFAKSVFSWCSVRRTKLGGDEGFPDEVDEIAVWNDIGRSVRRHFGEDPTLSQFLQELDLRQKTSPPKDEQVQCLTIHLAKGKEFKHVYLTGVVEDQLPSYYAKQKGDHSRELEEERRSCFVAITRAQAQLTLTFAKSYFGWPKKPSRFLTEMRVDLGPAPFQ